MMFHIRFRSSTEFPLIRQPSRQQAMNRELEHPLRAGSPSALVPFAVRPSIIVNRPAPRPIAPKPQKIARIVTTTGASS
jgi:hypothetical protein